MDSIVTALLRPGTGVPILIVFALGVASVAALVVVRRGILRAIRNNDQTFPQAFAEALRFPLSDSLESKLLSRLSRCVEKEIADSPTTTAESSCPPRWVAHGDLDLSYAESCSDALQGSNRWSWLLLQIGDSLTGISLIFTFALIAWVLISDVPAAIGGVASTNAEQIHAGNESLKTAVALMGAKFSISAVGLLLALVFRSVQARARLDIRAKAVESIRNNARWFVTREEYRFEQLRNQLSQVHDRQLGTTEGIVATIDRQTDVLGDRLSQLGSIEVSLKDIGLEVKTHLGLLMKEHIADQICTALADLRAYADDVATRMQTALSETFASALSGEIQRVRDALEALRATVAQQAKSDVANLIEQMRDMLSGGFQSEAKSMVAAMAALREVLPQLEAQMRRMTNDVDRDMRQRSEVSQKMQEGFLAQMQAMLATSQEHQAAASATLARLLESAERSTTDLQARLAGSGHEVVKNLVDTAERGFLNLREQFEAFNKLAASNVEEFGREVTAARDALANTRASLLDAVAHVERLTEQLRTGLDGQNRVAEESKQALEAYTEAARSVESAIARLSTTVVHLDQQLQNEQRILAGQRELSETTLPRLLTEFGNAVDQQTARLRTGWKELADKVHDMVSASGDSLKDAVEELVDQVQSLQKILERVEAARR